MTVRDATERDLSSIREFLRAYVDEFWNRPFPQPEFNPDYLATGKVLVAEESGDVTGVAKGVLHEGCGHASFIYVDPRRRGRGIGRALLRGLCDRFTEQNVVTVTLGVDTSNPDGLAYWERFGLREFHRELATPLDALKRRVKAQGR